ncbi:MAG: hypothetical protein V2J55_15765 [Candidatus Competibacteraceae bacterium]|jgi:hypothetical protein|nr:hypothetical protein [Candidatus Competibacteraceae bacterium]
MNLSLSLVMPLVTITSVPAYGQYADLSGWGIDPLFDRSMLVNMGNLIYQWHLERKSWQLGYDLRYVKTDPRRAWQYDGDDYIYGINTYIPADDLNKTITH